MYLFLLLVLLLCVHALSECVCVCACETRRAHTRGCGDTYLFLYPPSSTHTHKHRASFFTQLQQHKLNLQKLPAHRRFNMANNNFKGSIINGPLAESVNDFFPFLRLVFPPLEYMFDNIHKSHHQDSLLRRVYVCVCQCAFMWARRYIGLHGTSCLPFLLLLLSQLLWFIMWSHNIVSGSCSLLLLVAKCIIIYMYL